jgi:hypothetical protein
MAGSMMAMRALVLATGLAALAGCASGGAGIGEDEKYALYEANAGEEVTSFRFTGSLRSWTPLGDRAVAVWVRGNEAYLLGLSGPCPDLAFANHIGLTSSMGRVTARFDKVIVPNNPMRVPCHIREIRPLDTQAIKDGERAIREGAEAGDQPSGT